MRRVEVTAPSHDVRGLMGSAFKDESARRVVAVYVNMAADAQTLRLTFAKGARRWPLRSLTPYVTSDRPGDELRRYPDIPAGRTVEIPPRSVVTLVAAFG
jgi:hypothetical protein